MRYYIVALFDSDSCDTLNPIQKSVSKKFKANRNLPVPYIALEILENPNIDKLDLVIEKVLTPYKKFKVELSENIFISDDFKTINVELHDRGYIRKIKNSLNDLLKLYGFNVKDINTENLSISLANLNYYQRDNRKKNFDITEFSQSLNLNNITFKISEFQIWKVPHNKREVKVKDYLLKEF